MNPLQLIELKYDHYYESNNERPYKIHHSKKKEKDRIEFTYKSQTNTKSLCWINTVCKNKIKSTTRAKWRSTRKTHQRIIYTSQCQQKPLCGCNYFNSDVKRRRKKKRVNERSKSKRREKSKKKNRVYETNSSIKSIQKTVCILVQPKSWFLRLRLCLWAMRYDVLHDVSRARHIHSNFLTKWWTLRRALETATNNEKKTDIRKWV